MQERRRGWCNSIGPAAWWASTRVAARPRERQRGALARHPRIRPAACPSAAPATAAKQGRGPLAHDAGWPAPRSVAQVARCETQPIRERSPAFDLARVREGALSWPPLSARSSARRCRRRRSRDCFRLASLAFRCPSGGRSVPAAMGFRLALDPIRSVRFAAMTTSAACVPSEQGERRRQRDARRRQKEAPPRCIHGSRGGSNGPARGWTSRAVDTPPTGA